jgi:hypothetical protein
MKLPARVALCLPAVGARRDSEQAEDALEMARDAIRLSLAVRRDEGDEIPLQMPMPSASSASSSRPHSLRSVSKLPRVRPDRLRRALLRAEFLEVRRSGSHR